MRLKHLSNSFLQVVITDADRCVPVGKPMSDTALVRAAIRLAAVKFSGGKSKRWRLGCQVVDGLQLDARTVRVSR